MNDKFNRQSVNRANQHQPVLLKKKTPIREYQLFPRFVSARGDTRIKPPSQILSISEAMNVSFTYYTETRQRTVGTITRRRSLTVLTLLLVVLQKEMCFWQAGLVVPRASYLHPCPLVHHRRHIFVRYFTRTNGTLSTCCTGEHTSASSPNKHSPWPGCW